MVIIKLKPNNVPIDNFIPPILNAIRPYIKSKDGQGILVKPKYKKIENKIMLTAKFFPKRKKLHKEKRNINTK